MAEREPMTKTVKASEARQQFSQLLNEVFRGETRVIVEKSGIPVVAIVSAEDFKQISRIEEERRRDFAILDVMREAFKDVPAEEIEREVSRALREIRGQKRREPSAATS